MTRRMMAPLLCMMLLGGCRPGRAVADQARCELGTAPAGSRLLVFSRTAGYRHESIPAGHAAIAAIGARLGITVEPTEDPAAFADDNLRRFAAVVFLSTSEDVLGPAQQDAFQRYIRGGGGFVGVHAAADTEYDWPFYGGVVGAYFKSHPAIQRATVHVADTSHPSTRCVPVVWSRTDEWYDFRSRPGAASTVLATLDERTYQGGTMGAPHPIAWHHAVDRGRAWYTAMGHTIESYAEPAFLDHLAGGILWAVQR